MREMTLDRTSSTGVRRRSSSEQIVSDPLSARADGKRRREPKSFTRFLLKFIGVRSEPKPPKTLPNDFLAALWNRGSRYSSEATLRALIRLAESGTKLDYSGLDRESAFRLRKNLLDHGELPRAVAAVRKTVDGWKDSPTKATVLEFLDRLIGSLKANFDALSSRTGQAGTDGRKPDEQEQDRLCSILSTAAYGAVRGHAAKRDQTPAQLAQAVLTKLERQVGS